MSRRASRQNPGCCSPLHPRCLSFQARRLPGGVCVCGERTWSCTHPLSVAGTAFVHLLCVRCAGGEAVWGRQAVRCVPNWSDRQPDVLTMQSHLFGLCVLVHFRAKRLPALFEKAAGATPANLLSHPFQAKILGNSSKVLARRIYRLKQRCAAAKKPYERRITVCERVWPLCAANSHVGACRGCAGRRRSPATQSPAPKTAPGCCLVVEPGCQNPGFPEIHSKIRKP